MKKEQLLEARFLYPAAIIIAALILGGSFYAVQASKQASIERQQRAKISLERELAQAKVAAEQKEKEDKAYAEYTQMVVLEQCIDGADKIYWNYIEANLSEKDGVYSGPMYHWNEAQKRKEKEEDRCFKLYKD